MNYSTLIVSGKDPDLLLQGQLTCDVTLCTDRHAIFGALCNRKGRILSHMWVYQQQDTYVLLLPTALIEPVMQALKPAAMLARIKLTQGAAKTFTPITESNNTQITLAKPLQDFAISACNTLTHSTWSQALFERGLIEINPCTCETFTPHMLHYPKVHAVSFDKGCYLGQEIIARTEYLGKTKRCAVSAILDSQQTPLVGQTLLDEADNTIGTIASVAQCTQTTWGLWLITTEQQAGTCQTSTLGILTWQHLPWDATTGTTAHHE